LKKDPNRSTLAPLTTPPGEAAVPPSKGKTRRIGPFNIAEHLVNWAIDYVGTNKRRYKTEIEAQEAGHTRTMATVIERALALYKEKHNK